MLNIYSREWRIIKESFEIKDFDHGFLLILQFQAKLPLDEVLNLIKPHTDKLLELCETWAASGAWNLVFKAYQLINRLELTLPEFDRFIEHYKAGLIRSILQDMKSIMYRSALEKVNILSKFKWPELDIVKKSASSIEFDEPEPLEESNYNFNLIEKTSINQKVNDFKEFLLFCKERLGLKKLPKIRWYSDKDNVGNGQPTFGSFDHEDQTISLVITNRHPLDIMRTLAHELCHYRQYLQNKLNNASGETGSPQENEANAEAGIIMRDWGKKRRDMFDDRPIQLVSEGFLRMHNWLEGLVNAIRSNDKREAGEELALLIEGQDWDIASILDGLQEYADEIDIPEFMYTQKAVFIKQLLWMFKNLDEYDWPEKWDLIQKNVDSIRAEGVRWPELDMIEKSLQANKLINEEDQTDIPSEVHEFIDTLSSEDVGKERIGDYVVHFEGFSEMCQTDAEARTHLPPSDPKHLVTYDDIYKQVLNDFKDREGGNEPLHYGLSGDELYPVFYAVFHKPALTEANLKHINQYHKDGGSLEGYVVDTDQPQLENYLASQGASFELVDAIKHRYHRIAIIRNMWVDEELRGGGIGTDLLEQAIGDAFAFGAEAVLLVADMAESNLMPLDKWYEKWGFVRIGTASGDPVMILDRTLNESWSKKYKKSIDCNNPKGFSQKAHCAGRRARQAGQKTKSKSVSENFADGKGPGRPGDSQRHGIPKGATIAQLEKAAKAPGRKGQLARWQLNMRRGRTKNESVVNESIVDKIVDNLNHNFIDDALTELTYTVFRDPSKITKYKTMVVDALNSRKTEILTYLLGLFKRTTISNVRYAVQPTLRAFRMLGVDWPELAVIQKSLETEKPEDDLYESLNKNEILPIQKFKVTNENSKLDAPTPTVGELAEKYHTSLLAVKQQLAKGIRVEMEHTTKIKVAKEIALDHLNEDLYYYEKLAKIEKKK